MKKSLSLRKLVTFVGLSLLTIKVGTSVPSAFGWDEKGSRQVLQKVAKENGPIVPQTALPQTYAEMTEILDRLSQARQKKFPSELRVETRLFIIDSPIGQAFVTNNNENPNELYSMIFVTTGLIKEFMKSSDPKSLLKGSLATIGTIAHELSHPIDKMDSRGLEQNGLTSSKRLNDTLSAQARELRADADAIDLVRDAGYPEDAVYQAIRVLDKDHQTSASFQAATEDHPPTSMRLSAQRLNLTDSRYKIGNTTVAPVNTSYRDEIEKYRGAHWTYVQPLSLTETIQRALDIPTIDRDNYYRTIEFNRLVLSMDQMLAENPRRDAAELQLLHHFFENISKEWWKYPGILNGQEMKKYFNAENASEKFLSYPSHEKALETLPYYQSPEHKKWVRKTFENWWGTQKPALPADYERGWGGMIQKAKLMNQIMCPADIFRTFDDQFKSTFTELLSDKGPQAHTHISDGNFNLSGLPFQQAYPVTNSTVPFEMEYRLADFIREMRPTLEKNTWLSYITNPQFGEGSSVIFPLTDSSLSTTRGLGVVNQRMLLTADPRKKEIWEKHKKILQEVWDKRGYYGTLDVVIDGMNIDWDPIMSGLDIPRAEGYSRLRSAVKDFTTSLDYINLLRDVSGPKIPEGLQRLKSADIVSKTEAPQWYDNTLAPYFSGELNPTLKRQPSVRRLAQDLFEKNYLRQYDPYYAETQAVRVVTRYLDQLSPQTALKNIGRLTGKITEIKDQDYQSLRIADQLPVLARAIDESNWPPEQKRGFLRRIFINSLQVDENTHLQGEAWFNTWQGNGLKSIYERKAIVEILKKNGAIKNSTEFVNLLRDSNPVVQLDQRWKDLKKDGVDIHPLNYLSQVANFENALSQELLTELQANPDTESKKKILFQFAERVMKPSLKVKANPELDNTAPIRRLKRLIISEAEKLHLTDSENLELFPLLTYSGPTRETDDFFSSKIVSYYDREKKSQVSVKIQSALKSDVISSNRLRVSLVKRLLQSQLDALIVNKDNPEKVREFVKKVSTMIPKRSSERDQYLEEIAWKLGIHGADLETLIEPLKSYAWREVNPLWVNGGAELVNYIEKMSDQSRAAMMENLMQPIGELPQFVEKELEATIYHEIITRNLYDENDDNRQLDAHKKAEEMASIAKAKLETTFLDSTPEEKIPLFETLITAGNKDDLEIETALGLARKHLDYKAGSEDELFLKSFLEVLPEHERSVTIAYLMSQKNEIKDNIASKFEVFDSVGIKFAQLSSIYKVFGEEVAQQTKELKSNAKKIPKIEHERILRSLLTPEELEKIDFSSLKNVANASMKAVDYIKLRDETELAILIQRPHAKNKIFTNLDLSSRFVKQLEKNGYQLPGGMTGAIIDSLGEQMGDELSGSTEARRIAEAKNVYNEYNIRLKDKLNGWTFDVPQVSSEFKVRDNLLFLNYIPSGVDLDHVSPEIKAQVGPAIVEASLNSLFEKGWFNADSHAANFLLTHQIRIDEKTKKIWVLDLGQVSDYTKTNPWSTDERYQLARFIEAFGKGDSSSLVKTALQMQKENSAKIDTTKLKRDLSKIFSNKLSTSPDRLIDVMNSLAENKLALKTKFSFGAFKGMLILQGENYVSPEEFERILTQSVTGVIKEKAPRYMIDNPVGALNAAARSLAACLRNALSTKSPKTAAAQ